MANAMKCDRCGKLYESYNTKKDNKNINGFIPVNLDVDRKYYSHGVTDLCPDCMKEFQNWMEEVKQMERLTKRDFSRITYNERRSIMCSSYCDNCSQGAGNCKTVKNMIKKLATYEDLEEQGLLVRFPCPIGTTVWDIYGMGIRKNVVSGIEYGKDGRWFLWANEDEWLGELNVVVFLTREEAENKLEELKNEI